MLILSRVCADFRNAEGRVIFRVTPASRLSFLEAPEEIRADPLFTLLLSEGSLEAVNSVDQQARLESDPLDHTDAAGKRKPARTTKKKVPEDIPSGTGAGKDAPTEILTSDTLPEAAP